jgi:hypothetical protein
MADIYSVAQTVSNAGATVATLGSNSRKVTATTQFGTRELTAITVTIGGTAINMTLSDGAAAGATGYTLSNSPYSAAVRALQGFAEVYAVYAPVATGFIALIAADTADGSEVATPNTQATTFGKMEAAIVAAVNAAKASATKDSTAAVTLPTIAIGTTL